MHNIEKGSNGRYLVGGNFNSKLDFLSIHDSCTTFTSAFFAEMDSSSNNLKYNKVSSSGYIRVIKAGLSGSSGSWGLILFNKSLQIGTKTIFIGEKWGISLLIFSDSVSDLLIDSGSNFDVVEARVNNGKCNVLYGKTGSTAFLFSAISMDINAKISSTSIARTVSYTDFLSAYIIDDNKFYLIGRSEDEIKVNFFESKNNNWRNALIGLPGLRFISSYHSGNFANLIIQREDSIILESIDFGNSSNQLKEIYLFKGDKVNIKAISQGASLYYIGTANSYVSAESAPIYISSDSNSFVAIDFESDGLIDTLLSLNVKNIFDYLIFNEYTIIYMDELNENTISAENQFLIPGLTTSIGFSSISGKIPYTQHSKPLPTACAKNKNIGTVIPNPSKANFGFQLNDWKLIELKSIIVFDINGRTVQNRVELNKIWVEMPGTYIIQYKYFESNILYRKKVVVTD